MTTMDDHPDRAAYIRGLRQLADFLEQNPGVPAAQFGTEVTAFAHGSDAEKRAQVENVAALLGIPVVVNESEWRVTVGFDGDVVYRALGLTERRTAAWHALTSYSDRVTP